MKQVLGYIWEGTCQYKSLDVDPFLKRIFTQMLPCLRNRLTLKALFHNFNLML